MKNEKCDAPKGSEERHGLETVSSPANPGKVISAQPLVDAGFDAKPGYWTGNGLDIEHTEVK